MGSMAVVLKIVKQIIELLEQEKEVARGKVKQIVKAAILDEEYSEKFKLPDIDEWDELAESLVEEHKLEYKIIYELILKACAAASPEEYDIPDFQDKNSPGEIDETLLNRVVDKTHKKFKSWARRQLREIALKKLPDVVG